MALILDTRFLLTYIFPPTLDDKRKIKNFFYRIIGDEEVFISPITIAEYLKIAGKIMGLTASEIMIRRFESAGVKVEPLTSEDRIRAGELSLKYPNIPLADLLIAAITLRLKGKIVSDDPHFKTIGLKTIWYR